VKRGVHPRIALQYQPVMTRARTALAIVAVAASAAACKADRSRPLSGPADAGATSEASPPRAPIAHGGAGDAGGADAGAAPAARDGGAAAAQPSDPAGKAPQPAEPANDRSDTGEAKGGKAAGGGAKQPANLKVLPRSWTLAQVSAYMKKQVTGGLGVKCNRCHDTRDYAADGNEHKQAARPMIAMTSALNREYFRGKQTLTCFTCHKGRESPGGK
jgi:hypothetical protein